MFTHFSNISWEVFTLDRNSLVNAHISRLELVNKSYIERDTLM